MPNLRAMVCFCRFAPGVSSAALGLRQRLVVDRISAVVDEQDGEAMDEEARRAAAPLELVASAEGNELFRMPLSSALSVSYEQAFGDDDEPLFLEDGSPQLTRIHGLRLTMPLQVAGRLDLRLEGAVPRGWAVGVSMRGTVRAG